MSAHVKTLRFFRSPIYSWSELSAEQQEWVRSIYTTLSVTDNENERYVLLKENDPEPLPLYMFLRLNNPGLWDGVYGTSYFTAYFIKINRTGEEALVCERCW